MPKKPTLAETRQATQALNGSQFVNYDLTADDKAIFKKWSAENAQAVFDMLDKLLDSGYYLSIKWDTYNGCYGCFLIAKATKGPNDGSILTGRGKTSLNAVLGALFRHFVVFVGEWDTDGYHRSGTDDE